MRVERAVLEVKASGERCLCDFTFDFYWQHLGSRLDMDATVSGISFKRMVQAAARIALDPDRPSFPQGLDHLSKADAAYSPVLIQP